MDIAIYRTFAYLRVWEVVKPKPAMPPIPIRVLTALDQTWSLSQGSKLAGSHFYILQLLPFISS